MRCREAAFEQLLDEQATPLGSPLFESVWSLAVMVDGSGGAAGGGELQDLLLATMLARLCWRVSGRAACCWSVPVRTLVHCTLRFCRSKGEAVTYQFHIGYAMMNQRLGLCVVWAQGGLPMVLFRDQWVCKKL